MSHKPIRTIACLAILVIAGVACGGGNDDQRGAGEQPAAGPAVTIKLIAFTPTEISVTAGSTVTWAQQDVATHTVTSGRVEQAGGTVTAMPDGKFDSGNIAKGQDFQFTFEAAGEYPFFCAIHPATMTGVIRAR